MIDVKRFRKAARISTIRGYSKDLCESIVRMWLKKNTLKSEEYKDEYIYEVLDSTNYIDCIDGKPLSSKKVRKYLMNDYEMVVDNTISYELSVTGIFDESKVNRDEILGKVQEYVTWLSDELSKTGFVQPDKIGEKAVELGICDREYYDYW